MANIFKLVSTTALNRISASADGQGVYNDGVNMPVLISAVLDKNVEFIQDDRYSYTEDGGQIFENSITMPSMTTTIGATITLNNKVWKVGRTLSDDGAIKVVIVE